MSNLTNEQLNRKLAEQAGYKGTPKDSAYLDAEALTEKNRKLAEWAGFKEVESGGLRISDGGFSIPKVWSYPHSEGVHNDLPNFPHSLDACFKWLVPKAIDRIMQEQECSSEVAYAILFKKWLQELELIIPNAALALCLAIEKLIDGGESK